MRRALAVLVVVLAACSGGNERDAACEQWDAIQGSDITDAQAVEQLNDLADEAENSNVRDKARDLATLLEGVATQTEVHAAYEDLDAACA